MSAPSELSSRLKAALGPQYRLERELGHGGMGVVFLARDTTLDRPVAVKVVHPDLAVHSSVTQRFLAEARMIARLRHPNIVAVHAAGEATGLVYYVMDYVPGESLRQRLTREERLPADEVADIVAGLADALHAAGQAGLVHRDVKPENVLLDSASGRPLLADFGIARAMVADASGNLTAQGVAVGTPTYMSPEQAAGEPVDHRSDLYSLGVVAYEMLAGRPPFRAANAAAVASMHLAERPAPLSTVRPDAPPGLTQAIMRALEKDPGQRWQNGAELRRAIVTGEIPAQARPRSLRRRLAGAAALLLLIASALIIGLRPGGPPRGVNARHSILVLPFVNVREDPDLDWLRDGSVNMLALTLSQWNDLTVIDHDRLHDLLDRRRLSIGDPIGLAMARRLARDAGTWTVVLGDYTRAGDSLHLVARVYDVASGTRVDVAQVEGQPGQDVRPLFDQLAARLLDLSGAPTGVTATLAQVTTPSLEAYRSYLRGIEALSRWDLGTAESHLRQAVAQDSAFGLAYYKLSLARGWIAGQNDSLGAVAIQRATRYADRLPEHDRAMIQAYRAFIDSNYAGGRAAYQELLARDSTDADAWYGLGDVTFHDTSSVGRQANWTTSLRAFKRAIALDPSYFLAYEHVAQIYFTASTPHPYLALLPGDSLAFPNPARGTQLDSVTLAAAVQRARNDGLGMARSWVTEQPDNAHAQNALLRAQLVRGDTQGALSSVTAFTQPTAALPRPDLPFVRGRLLAASGDLVEGVKSIARALDTTRAGQFDPGRLPLGEAMSDVASAANVLLYTGHMRLAEQLLELSSSIHSGMGMPSSREVDGRSLYGHLLMGNLYAAIGAPDKLRPIWEAIAEEARKTPKAGRALVAQYGWSAAVGLFLANPTDPTSLNELQALGGGEPPPELAALMAMGRGDTGEARRLLSQPDSVRLSPEFKSRPVWGSLRIPIAAGAWLDLGEPAKTLDLLQGFKMDQRDLTLAVQFDVRWALSGQVRLLRAAALERLGREGEAAEEYRQVLAQWEGGDQLVGPWLREAKVGLARIEAKG